MGGSGALDPQAPVKERSLHNPPRLLDLFCGAGGAAMGYHRAGFEVVGVDIKPQPHYPFEFHRGDALDWLRSGFSNFDVIHASPPCQRFTRFQQSQPQRKNRHIDWIGPTRRVLDRTEKPWVIENVPGAPLIAPVMICGTAFGLGADRGLGLRASRGQLWRHRLFESNWEIVGTQCQHDGNPAVMVTGHGKDGYRGSGLTAAEAREAMQIDWMNRDEMAEAIPPAYTEWIGKQLMGYVMAARAAA